MACSVPHTDDEIQALVQKVIDEDMVRQKAILDLALQFDDACTAKDDLRKAYEKCNDIPQESCALIDNFLKEGSDKDYELNLSMYKKAAKIEKQMNAKLVCLREKYNYRSQTHIDEEALRETLEEEARDEKEREEKIRQKQADEEEFMLEFEVKYDSEYDIVFSNFKFQRLLFPYKYPFTIVHFLTQLLIQLSQMDFNLNNENDPWEFSLDIDDSDLHLTPVLRPSSSTRVEPSPSTPNLVRIIHGLAGIVQAAKLLKQRDILLGLDEAVMSTQEYMKKMVEDVGEDEDFKSGAWVSATDYVNANGGTVTGCLGDIKNFLKNEKLNQVVAIVKSCSPNAIGDLTVTMKDLSGTIPETIHYKVISDGGYGKDITIRAALLLANISVFSPKPSMHYLNITMRNVVMVFRKDTVPGSGSG
ncbi:transposase, MuDR, MULE transposase domain protein [Tanacetum coccineum]